MLAIGNDELGDELGTHIECPHCGGRHEVKHGTARDSDGNEVPSMLQYYRCGETLYLAGIKGREVTPPTTAGPTHPARRR